MILNSLTWVLWSKILMCMCTRIKTFFTENYSFFSSRHHAHNTNASTLIDDFFLHPLDHRKKKYKSLKRRETKKYYIDCQRQVYVYKSLKKTSRIKSMNNVYRTYRIYSWNLWVNFFFFLIEDRGILHEDGGDPQFTPESNFPIKSSLCIINSIKLKPDLID